MALNRKEQLERRHMRVRHKVAGTPERPRLLVRKSLKHLYAQVLDDSSDRGSKTLLAVSTEKLSADAKPGKGFRNVASAKVLGASVGEMLKTKGVKAVVFDRGGYRYHGVVRALADAVRETGIQF